MKILIYPAAETVMAILVCCSGILRYIAQLRTPVECHSGLSTTCYSRLLSVVHRTRSGRG